MSSNTDKLVDNLPSSDYGNTPDDSGNQTAEEKRSQGLGDRNYISYRIPWILYFFPDPKSDPNYILLNPEHDKIFLNNRKNQILGMISLLTFMGLLYAFWTSGVLFPALHTMWFFFWRYITLILFFFCFGLMIGLIKIFPYFGRNIQKYFRLTLDPLKYKPARDKYNTYSNNFNWTIKWGYRIGFGLAFLGWLFLTLFILSPALCVFAVIIGLLLGDLNTMAFAFGMAEYEVTELQKKSMKSRIEDFTGITRLKSGISSAMTKMDDKTGLSSGMSKLKEMTQNPFLKPNPL